MFWLYIVGAIVVFFGFSAFFGAPYVPSRRRDVRRMFDNLYPVTEDDMLLDFGSGDGIILREVSRRGGRAIGYEINPVLALLSKLLSANDSRVEVKVANFWLSAFPEGTTAVYAFSVTRDGKRLAEKMQREADRLATPLVLICYGSPLPVVLPASQYEAFHLYEFHPLQVG
jgi:hypothetical protein